MSHHISVTDFANGSRWQCTCGASGFANSSWTEDRSAANAAAWAAGNAHAAERKERG